MNIYVIIGEAGTGKSSIIRSLTGLDHKGDTEILQDNKTVIGITVRIRSAQEERVDVEQLLNDISQSNYPNFLLALRRNTHNGLPDANSYLNSLRQHGHLISQIVQLNFNDYSFLNHGPVLSIKDISDKTVNECASMIRKSWGWE